jgi:hypothetical protein
MLALGAAMICTFSAVLNAEQPLEEIESEYVTV